MRQPEPFSISGAILACTSLVFVVFWSGCSPNTSGDSAFTSPIQGMAMPFRLAPDSTWVTLSDFCPAGSPDLAVWIPDWGMGDTLTLIKRSGELGVWIQGQPENGLGALALSIQEETATVPVLSSVLLQVTYTLPHRNKAAKGRLYHGCVQRLVQNKSPLDFECR